MQLRRIAGVARTPGGAAIPGATITVRRLGATVTVVNSSTDFLVSDPGAIAVADSVRINANALTRTVTSVPGAGGEVQVGGPGFAGVNPGDRITPTNSLPSIYSDEDGTLVASNPITANTDGSFEFFVAEPVDLLFSAGSTDIVLLRNYGSAPEIFESWVENLSTATGWVFRTRHTISSASMKLFRLQNPINTDIFYVRADGGVYSAGITVFDDDVTINGTLTTAGGVTLAPGQAVANLQVGDITVPLSDDDTADYVITNAYVKIPNVTKTLTPATAASLLFVEAVVPVEFTTPTAGGNTVVAQLLENVNGGGDTVIDEGGTSHGTGANNGDPSHITLIAPIRTGISQSTVYSVQIKKTTNTGTYTVKNSGNQKARLVIIEFKR